MRYLPTDGLILLLLSACSTPAVRMPAPVPVPIPDTLYRGGRVEPLGEPPADSLGRRWAVRPLPVTRAFERAVARGTRTTTGEPGPKYWQQRVQYRIAAELDPATSLLRGEETVRYQNRSPDTLRSVLVNLYQNAYAEGAQRVRRVPITGGMILDRVSVGGRELSAGAGATGGRRGMRASSSGYRIDGTLMTLPLASPLPPGGEVELSFSWSFRVPPEGAPRTGNSKREAYVVAQWYPQIAVYDDVRGWHDVPYWTNGEFYLEYGDFDVALTLPAGWIVGATGELQNAAEVLSVRTRERLQQALAQDSVVRVVTEAELRAGGATSRSQGKLTWQFRARDVRDFAFATSSRYLWDATRITAAGGSPIAVHALYRPEATSWREAARYMKHSTAYHAAHWHPYIYPQITAAEGPIGGMEYPMLVFIGAPGTPQGLYGVLSHEIAHEWFPMMVGSNETLYAWQDEGTVTYMEDLTVAEYFPGSRPAVSTQDSYLGIADTDQEKPVMTPADLFGVGPQYSIAAYSKPGSLLRALSHVLGQEVFTRGLRTYADRWLLRHPTPFDLFDTFEQVSGRDLDWFWTPWYFETAWLDQGIAAVVQGGNRVTITVEDIGTAPMPADIVATFADGSVQRIALPVEPWLAGHRTQTAVLDATAAVARVEIDPERWYPDRERDNNVWVRQ